MRHARASRVYRPSRCQPGLEAAARFRCGYRSDGGANVAVPRLPVACFEVVGASPRIVCCAEHGVGGLREHGAEVVAEAMPAYRVDAPASVAVAGGFSLVM